MEFIDYTLAENKAKSPNVEGIVLPAAGIRWEWRFESGKLVVGGRGGKWNNTSHPHEPYQRLLPAQTKVTAVYVYANDNFNNVPNAILRVQANNANGTVLQPDWQDVKVAGSMLQYQAPDSGTQASSLLFTSHHIGHISGDDETVMLRIFVYGY